MIKKIYKDDTAALESFNALTRNTFGFDFTGWHAAGHFSDMYVPHVWMENGKVVSNVSVNRMQFDMGGAVKNYIQIGTVMTDEEYRGQGLNRKIMESILQEYAGKVDGIYLFGNDSVLEYYPKFGFVPCEEYEYYFAYDKNSDVVPYDMEKVDMADEAQAKKLYALMKNYAATPDVPNENDAFYMNENICLYHFWLDAIYNNNVYYLPECGVYVVATVEDDKLNLYQIIGKAKADVKRIAKAYREEFAEEFTEVVLGYTPVHKDGLSVRIHKEEDCTLFIIGEDLRCVSESKMMFPILSHA